MPDLDSILGGLAQVPHRYPPIPADFDRLSGSDLANLDSSAPTDIPQCAIVPMPSLRGVEALGLDRHERRCQAPRARLESRDST